MMTRRFQGPEKLRQVSTFTAFYIYCNLDDFFLVTRSLRDKNTFFTCDFWQQTDYQLYVNLYVSVYFFSF